MDGGRSALLERLALMLERECRTAGVDIEPEVTTIIRKLKERRHAKQQDEARPQAPPDELRDI